MESLEVRFEVRRSHFVWMYLGSWGGVVALIPGLFLIFIGLVPVGSDPFKNSMFFVVAGLGLLVAGPAYLCWLLMSVNGVSRVIGGTVTLRIDDVGVWGWPLAEGLDTSWERVRRARKLRGVIALPFRQPFGTRQGWVPIPEAALTPTQHRDLWSLLADKGLARRSK